MLFFHPNSDVILANSSFSLFALEIQFVRFFILKIPVNAVFFELQQGRALYTFQNKRENFSFCHHQPISNSKGLSKCELPL